MGIVLTKVVLALALLSFLISCASCVFELFPLQQKHTLNVQRVSAAEQASVMLRMVASSVPLVPTQPAEDR